MPSMRHEFLIDLFRTNPLLLPTLLQHVLHLQLPAFTAIRWVEGGLSDLPPEFRADLVLVLSFGEQAVLVVVLEVQLARDEVKRQVWPGYLGVARARYHCPASLVVVTLDPEVQSWAGQTIVDAVPGGLSLRPVALGPGDYPALSAQQAAEEPELAMISVLSRQAAKDLVQVAEATLAGLRDLPEDRRRLYSEIIFALFREACRKGLLETQMMTQLLDKYRNEFRGFYEEGKADGKADGKAEGKADGKAEGKAESILAVLRTRALAVLPEQEKRILICKDADLLSRWLIRAVTVATANDIFQDG